jgi:hypothetical protein
MLVHARRKKTEIVENSVTRHVFKFERKTGKHIMKSIDWNQLAELGLMAKINQEVLHPLGLAVTRNPETGVSEGILVSDDGEFGYGKEMKVIIDELQREPVEPRLLKMIGGSRTE